MPSKTVPQAKLFAAAAHDSSFAKKVGVPMSVAKEFNRADVKTGILRKKRKKQTGGVAPASDGAIGGR